jgi:CDP-diacylglycerol--glycerol-3-phosphate 3-phosphatidyltransferase
MLDGRWRKGVDKSTKPVGKFLVKLGIKANHLTLFGLAMSAVLAVVVGSGHLIWGIPLLFLAGLPDLFDGPVAKASSSTSVRGAFLDSVSDRASDALMFSGVAWYLIRVHEGELALLPVAILSVTYLISYQRSKAELLGIPAKGGLMERAERFILLGVAFLSPQGLVPVLWVFLGLVSITAIGRFRRVWVAAGAGTASAEAASVGTVRSYKISWLPGARASQSTSMTHQREPIEERLRAWRIERLDRRRAAKESHRAKREDRRMRRNGEWKSQVDKIKAWRTSSKVAR